MIRGIGIDIVEVRRMERWRKNPGLLERYFNREEIDTAISRGKGADMALAARFAAKEAFGKALGTGLEGIVLKDITINNKSNGRPEVHVSGTAFDALQKAGANIVHISLSHERDNAVAMIILESI